MNSVTEKIGKILELQHHERHVRIYDMHPNRTLGIVNFKTFVLKFTTNPLHSDSQKWNLQPGRP
jgi:hypothetical protein